MNIGVLLGLLLAAFPAASKAQVDQNEFHATQERLVTAANRAYDAELKVNREHACAHAESTYDINQCFSKQLRATRENSENFSRSLRRLLALPYPDEASFPPSEPSAAKTGREFDQTELLWRRYLNSQCEAALHQYGAGTGGPAFEMQCEIRILRQHMRDLGFV